MRIDDAESLVRRLRCGEEAAWQEYMRVPGRIILAVGRRFGLSQADREELFQDTCLQVYRSIHGLRDPEKLFSWTYSIAYRTAIQRIQRRQVPTVPDDPEGRPLLEGIPADEPSPEELVAQLEDARHVRAALARLPDSCRRLLTALYLDEPPPSYREISKRLKTPLGSIGPTRARCLEKLKIAIRDVSPRGPEATTHPGGAGGAAEAQVRGSLKRP